MRPSLILVIFFTSIALQAQNNIQKPVRILFIGNSYIYVNDLPKILTDMAATTGDKIIWDSSAPGGYTFRQHSTDTATLRRIKSGHWDFAVLQEQSQLPSASMNDVQEKVYPYARFLDSLTHAYSPKSKTVFYMTWGRKNGDKARCAALPEVCTYKGMDSLLTARYTAMAKANHALISPVARVWKYLREKNPSIELYNADESHPSEAGSYATASCFYAVILKKDPTLIKYDFTLSAKDAASIRMAVKKVLGAKF